MLERQKKLIKLVDTYGFDAVLNISGLTQRTLKSYLKVPNRFVRMTPMYRIIKWEKQLNVLRKSN